MLRQTRFTVLDNGKVQTPSRLWAGVQYEDNATEVVFVIQALYGVDSAYKTDALWRIDFDSPEAGYDAGANTEPYTDDADGAVISRGLPYKFTRYGGEVQAVLVGTRTDEDGNAEIICSVPVMLYLTEAEKHEATGECVAENISAVEESVRKMSEAAATSMEEAKSSAETAVEARALTELAQRALEEDTVFVFSGGDATRAARVELAVDDEMSQASMNPVQNQTVTNYIYGLHHALDGRVSGIEEGVADLSEKTTYLSATAEALSEKASELDKRSEVYLVEYGTSGIWTYKKWSDGTAACWGRNTVIRSISAVTYEVFWYSDPEAFLPIEYPFEFAEVPHEFASYHASNTLMGWHYSQNTNTTTKTGKYNVMRWSKAETEGEMYLDYLVIGRWKAAEETEETNGE